MARRLTDGAHDGRLSRDTVEQFSKWCTEWDDGSSFVGSVNAAEDLSHILFGEVVPRMRDNHNRPVENAEQLWLAFCRRLTARRV